MIKLGMSRPVAAATRMLARAAGVEDPAIAWRQLDDGPWFDNQVAMLEADGRRLEMRLEKAVPVDEDDGRLECVLARRLA